MSDFKVRRATPSDLDFLTQCNLEMALETENKNLDSEIVFEGIRGLIENPERGFYVVVETDANSVGCLAITFEWSDWRNGLFWWIQSVYVMPSFRRLGVFRTLYEHIESEARKQEDVCGIRLYVERENARAQQTYSHLGMIETAYRLFETEF